MGTASFIGITMSLILRTQRGKVHRADYLSGSSLALHCRSTRVKSRPVPASLNEPFLPFLQLVYAQIATTI
jgi:hypothetical protein